MARQEMIPQGAQDIRPNKKKDGKTRELKDKKIKQAATGGRKLDNRRRRLGTKKQQKKRSPGLGAIKVP